MKLNEDDNESKELKLTFWNIKLKKMGRKRRGIWNGL